MLQSGTIYLNVQRIAFAPSSFYAFQKEKLPIACKEFEDLLDGWMALSIKNLGNGWSKSIVLENKVDINFDFGMEPKN